MTTEIRNAIIKDVSIFIEDHGILTSFVDLDYGNSAQGFGGYSLEESMGRWLRGLFKVFGVTDIKSLKGKPCRVRIEGGLARSIGHLLDDRWFTPATDL